jgi:hypothetical protein
MNPNHELSNGKFGLLSTEMICERMQTAAIALVMSSLKMYFVGPISGDRILLLEIWPGMKVGINFLGNLKDGFLYQWMAFLIFIINKFTSMSF